MNLFELAAKISLDSKDYEKGISSAKSKMSSLKNGIINVTKSVGDMGRKIYETGETAVKSFTGISTAIGAAAGALVKLSVDSYGDLEQLEGGVETLFKESADSVKKYAEDAYKTAGLSANKYMETVTSFSASLLQSLNNDTAAAAEYANMALTDMSDNANKMATDMSMIQNAYQGFAKQNYTMLDNLKLGYGGTKTEMERLVADAAQLDDSIDASSLSFGNIVKAIHAVQTEMGITGTTAKEAATTIQGSAATMKSAWENFLSALATGSDKADERLELLIESATTYAENLIPVIKRTIGSIFDIVEKNSDRAVDFVVGLFGDAAKKAPEMIKNGNNLIRKVIKAISKNKNSLKKDALDIFGALLEGFQTVLSDILPLAQDLIPTFVKILIGYHGAAFNAGIDIITAIVEGIASDADGLANAAVSAVDGLIDKIGSQTVLGRLLEAGKKIVGAIGGAILNNLDGLLDGVGGIISKIVTELGNPQMLKGLADGAVSIITSLVNFFGDNLGDIATGAINIIKRLVTAFADADSLKKLEDAVPTIINGLCDALIKLTDPDKLSNILAACVKIIWALVKGIGQSLDDLALAAADIVKNLILAIVDAIGEIFGLTPNKKNLIKQKGPISGGNDDRGARPGGGDNWGVIGSHRNGLSYVPYDGYIAELHKGERILTKSEARNYGAGGGISISVTVNGAKYNDEESLAEAVAEKIQDMIERGRAAHA